jgi:hypothetical protein
VAAHTRRWTTYPSPQTSAPPSAMMPEAWGQRPFSSPVSLPSSYPSTPFIPSPGAIFSPPAGASEFRPILSYTDRPLAITPPTISPQQYPQPFPPSLAPHVQSPQTPTRPTERETSAREPLDPYRESALRLPPILPSTRSFVQSPPTHRRSGSYPYPTAWTGGRLQASELQPPPLESPRSLLEPLSSQSELRSPFPAVTRPPGQVFEHERPGPVTQPQQWPEQSPVRVESRSETRPQRRRREEGDEGDDNQQPTKRRRMALDDIVND